MREAARTRQALKTAVIICICTSTQTCVETPTSNRKEKGEWWEAKDRKSDDFGHAYNLND